MTDVSPDGVTFRDAIAIALPPHHWKGWIHNRPLADVILATPEMQAIKASLRKIYRPRFATQRLTPNGYLRDYTPDEAARDDMRKAELPATVIDWVLS